MLFNSTIFIFVFLPVVLFFSFLLKGQVRLFFIFLSSLVFIGYLNSFYAYLLLFYIVTNYIISVFIHNKPKYAYALFIAGVAANLAPLIYFKYFTFLVDIAHWDFGSKSYIQTIIPLGISFYTFKQILYLRLIWKKEIPLPAPVEYATYVCFFPQLIAGPITNPRRIIPQFSLKKRRLIFIAAGFSLFAIGLFKKLIIADQLALPADRMFAFLALGQHTNPIETAMGVLAFTMQIYFDFSAYCDMAVGLGCLFFVRLPVNFYSPYKSRNFVIFWRRWHITLGNFFHYVFYTPLKEKIGKGPAGHIAALLATFLLLGVWHGAGMTFVCFGLYHGICTAVSYVFYKWSHNKITLPAFISCSLTFIFVTLGFGIFRSPDMTTVRNMFSSLGTLHKNFWYDLKHLDTDFHQYVSTVTSTDYVVLAVSLIIAFGFPATVQLFPQFFDVRDCRYKEGIFGYKYRWRPNVWWAIITAIAFVVAILNLGKQNQFLYFQF